MDIPIFPVCVVDFLSTFLSMLTLLEAVGLVEDDDNNELLPVLPTEILDLTLSLISLIRDVIDNYIPIQRVLIDLYGYAPMPRPYVSVYNFMSQSVVNFWFSTGETVESFTDLLDIIRPMLPDQRQHVLSPADRLLMVLIWMRQYPTIHSLGNLFAVTNSTVHEDIATLIPILHYCLVSRWIRWHDPHSWHMLRGTLENFPSVVGLMDCTPIRINTPRGRLQRLYYRRDRSCHFINWLVIADVNGYFTFGRAGFRGHLIDSVCVKYTNYHRVCI